MVGSFGIRCTLVLVGMLVILPPSEAFLELLLKDDLVRLFLGTSTPFYLVEEGYDSQLARSGVLQYLPALEPNRARLTFEWSAKKEIHYVIHVHSGDTKLMRVPRISIPLTSTVPLKSTEFHIDFPCTGHTGGTTFLAITFAFYDSDSKRPLYNEPFTLAMARKCTVGKLDETKMADVVAKYSDEEKEKLQLLLGYELGANKQPPRKLAPILYTPKVKSRFSSHPGIVSVPPTINTHPPTKDKPTALTKELVTSPQTEEIATTAAASTVAPTVRKPCRMCHLPTDLSALKETLCRSAFAIRTRLDKASKSKTSSPNRLSFLSIRDVKELHASRDAISSAIRSLHAGLEPVRRGLRMRVNSGKPGLCTCQIRINHDLYLVAGKFSSRRSELIVRHNNGLIIPWREAKHMIRQLRPLRCDK